MDIFTQEAFSFEASIFSTLKHALQVFDLTLMLSLRMPLSQPEVKNDNHRGGNFSLISRIESRI
jgi:hypothetical protein